MSITQCFTYSEDRNVRVQVIDDKPWFCAKDVCNILELTNVSKATSTIKTEQVSTITLSYSGRHTTNVIFVSEAGLYKLIFKSRTPAAEAFQEWVCEEVLPTIRKTGRYEVGADKAIEMERERYRNGLAERIMSTPALVSDFHLRELAKEHLTSIIRAGTTKTETVRYKDLTTLMQEVGYADRVIHAERTRLGRHICKKYRAMGHTPSTVIKMVNGGDREVKAYPPEHYELIQGWIRELMDK